MAVYATVATIFYVIALAAFILAFYYQKRNRKRYEKTLAAAIGSLAIFIGFMTLAISTDDPIPFWNFIIFTGIFLMGYGFIVYPDYIASKVKDTLTEPEEKIELRKLTEKQAEREIIDYLKHRRKEVWIEDVVNDLRIEPDVAVKIIRQLEKKGKIR